jgi:DNA-binding Lrp family transcriptional regulator
MLTKLEIRILGQVQEPLTICQRPFEAMARRVGCTAGEVIETINSLKAGGYIRRYSAFVNYQVLGRTASLVAASVPQRKLKTVITAINSLAGVSHHYMRKHRFNLWFTLQGKSRTNIQQVLGRLTKKTGVEFYSLPAERVFKLDARFSPKGPSRNDFKAATFRHPKSSDAGVRLTKVEKKTLVLLQQDIPLIQRPFDMLSRQSGIEDFLAIARQLAAKKVIHRIAAAAAYRKLGYETNVMACFAVPQDKIESAAMWLSARPAVSHCYQRRVFDGWPYNLFAMMHGGQIGDLRGFAGEAARRFGITEWELLPTQKELKKKPVMIR